MSSVALDALANALERAEHKIALLEAQANRHESAHQALKDEYELQQSSHGVMQAALERIENAAEICLTRIAEVGPPPIHLSGTQLDPERLRDLAREALASTQRAPA